MSFNFNFKDISVGIVCMVNHTALQNSSVKLNAFDENSEITKCKFQNSSSHQNPDGPFLWEKNIQELILSSYFYGYITSQVIRIY